MSRAICPVCWHEETRRALLHGGEPDHEDAASMLWQEPHKGVAAQEGHWRCQNCDIVLPPRSAAILLDAVLRVSDPDSDSFDGESFADAVAAGRGGR